MAAESRRAADRLTRQLLAEPYRFDIFHALRVLEALHPGAPRLGEDRGPAGEPVRLRPHLSFAFPPSTIHEIEDRRGEGEAAPFRMTVSFMGLYGRGGVLPWHYTERLLEEEKNRRGGFREFLDIFNHRFLSFFYRAWLKYRYPLRFEPGGADPLSGAFLALLGLGTRGLRGRLGIAEARLVAYAGLFPQRHSASALKTLLADFLGVRVEVRQFQGEWVTIHPDDRNRLGRSGRNNQLGRSLSVGRRIWSAEHKFRLVLGPLGLESFLDLLPGTERFGQLVRLTRFYAGDSLDFDIQAVLRREEVPGTRLGSPAARLGWTTWLKSVERESDASDAVFRPQAGGERSDARAA